MPKRRVPLPRHKAGFVKALIAGESKSEAARKHLGLSLIDPKPFNLRETREMNQHLVTSAADRAMADERVGSALLEELRKYQSTWRDLEEAARGVFTRHMAGKEMMPDPQNPEKLIPMPIEGLEPWQIEQLRHRTALAVLQALAKTDPDAFTEKADREDQAAKTLPEMARMIVGEHSKPALPPPEVVPGPSDEEAH